MYIYIYIYIYTIYVYNIHIHINTNVYNVFYWLLPIRQMPYGNSCNLTRNVRLHVARTNEPKNVEQVQ